jgi:hypothetical protein
MAAIEPNWIPLLWFAAFATICTLACLVVAGMFPRAARPESARSGVATLLVAGNAILLTALLIGTGLYGCAELRWSSLIVVAGLAVLFAPGLFEIWPASFRDGRNGLVVLAGVQLAALATLARIAAPHWADLS